MADDQDLTTALFLLRNSPNYRVLERLRSPDLVNAEIANEDFIGIALDVETTGLDVELDEVIELAMIKFTYSRDGKIGRVLDTYRSFNEPTKQIPLSITDLTGIHQSDVTGQRIDSSDLDKFIQQASLIVAHNAAFDRPFCEGLLDRFSEMPWACSATQINWRMEGIAGTRLEYIAYSFGTFYDAHRALDDCGALLNILSFALPKSKRLSFAALLDAARRTDIRIYADGAPFELRLPLKLRGYRWNDGQNGYPRAWWTDVPSKAVDDEIAYITGLASSSSFEPKLVPMSAKTRFRHESQRKA